MNLQQLEYLIAIDECNSFLKAAQKCFVTQSTLSIMIKKLEDEMNVVLFDRSKHPVHATEIGKSFIRQAKIILHEVDKMQTLVQEQTQLLSGSHSLGIIPTLAPYLLPLFIDSFLKKHPGITLHVYEMTTDLIVQKLLARDLDIGLLAIPNYHNNLVEHPLFTEEFIVYAPGIKPKKDKKFILPTEIDIHKLWLLEEGHCLRNQVINLCELKEKERKNHPLDFSAGSIETLKRMVDANLGITILPMLSLDTLSEKERNHVYFFHKPAPAREIGLITHEYFVKKKLLESLQEEILRAIPPSIHMSGV